MPVATSLRLTMSTLCLVVATTACQASAGAYQSSGSSAPTAADPTASQRLAVRMTVQGVTQVRWVVARQVEDVLNSVPGVVALPRGTDDLVLRIWGRGKPTIMIDGVHALESDLLFLYPWEIGAIEVLRDVPATAVFGALGTNGVIRVTTKRTRQPLMD
jgi:outer membrane receptor protein involved in Fe transport